MDTRFSVAVHVLILISESSRPIDSETMARSVGTNASYIRKVLGLLKKANIVSSHQGRTGFSLLIPAEQLTLLQVYQAVMEKPQCHLLDVHQNASDQCIVGRHIRPVLTDMFEQAESAFTRALAEQTLSQCIAGIRARLPSE